MEGDQRATARQWWSDVSISNLAGRRKGGWSFKMLLRWTSYAMIVLSGWASVDVNMTKKIRKPTYKCNTDTSGVVSWWRVLLMTKTFLWFYEGNLRENSPVARSPESVFSSVSVCCSHQRMKVKEKIFRLFITCKALKKVQRIFCRMRRWWYRCFGLDSLLSEPWRIDCFRRLSWNRREQR